MSITPTPDSEINVGSDLLDGTFSKYNDNPIELFKREFSAIIAGTYITIPDDMSLMEVVLLGGGGGGGGGRYAGVPLGGSGGGSGTVKHLFIPVSGGVEVYFTVGGGGFGGLSSGSGLPGGWTKIDDTGEFGGPYIAKGGAGGDGSQSPYKGNYLSDSGFTCRGGDAGAVGASGESGSKGFSLFGGTPGAGGAGDGSAAMGGGGGAGVAFPFPFHTTLGLSSGGAGGAYDNNGSAATGYGCGGGGAGSRSVNDAINYTGGQGKQGAIFFRYVA